MNERMGDKLRWTAEVLLFGLAVLDAWLGTEPEWSLSTVAVAVAVLALPLRRRHPYVAFVLTLPMLALSYAVVAVLITLYGVARHTRDRRALAWCSTAVAIGYAVPWPDKVDLISGPSIMVDVIYALMMGAAPAFLGQLVQARRDLSLRLAEINEAREHERELIAQTVLAKERAQLAREMHDVVSHQVSLIAVQAGGAPGQPARSGDQGSRRHHPPAQCRYAGRASAHGRAAAGVGQRGHRPCAATDADRASHAHSEQWHRHHRRGHHAHRR
ncbi:histidine kinase [Kibdelosporangium aridum]|uniref:histidine kinase n=1 Tax=Kibdelosporangium aridum TaxID=2030 RepID=UPI0035EE8B5D